MSVVAMQLPNANFSGVSVLTDCPKLTVSNPVNYRAEHKSKVGKLHLRKPKEIPVSEDIE